MPDASAALADPFNVKDGGYDFLHSLARNHSQHSSTDQLIMSPQSYDPYEHDCYPEIAKEHGQGDFENFSNNNTYNAKDVEQEWDV